MSGSARLHGSPSISPIPFARGGVTPPVDPVAHSEFANHFGVELRDRAQVLWEDATAPLRQPVSGSIDLMALLHAYCELIPAECREDSLRALSVMETLFHMRVAPSDLKILVDRGRSRDGWRSLATAELVYALSFCAANAVPLVLPDIQLLDARDYGLSAANLVAVVNTTVSFLLAGGIIAVGAEGADAVVREGKMGSTYNVAAVASEGRAIPFFKSANGQRVQALSAWPFGAAYAADDALRDRFHTAPAWRLLFGAGAAAVAALFRVGCAERSVDRLDPVWLDASTDAKREAMTSAIHALRQEPVRASAGYVANHLVPGMAASLGETISAKGAARMATRLVAASVARAGALATAATDAGRSLAAKLASDAWLGLTWGSLSTWPQRGLDCAALGRAQEAGAPVMARPPVQDVLPPARPAAGPILFP